MTLRIFKYPLAPRSVNMVNAPIEKPLHVDFQDGRPMLWALVDTDAPEREYEVLCFGTGEQVPNSIIGVTYLNTTIIADDRLVFHWFFAAAKEV